MTDVDAAQLKLTMKQIMQITAFLIVIGLSLASGIVGAVTWKAGIEDRLDKIDQNQREERQEILWIMENMQRKAGSQDYVPQDFDHPKVNLNLIPDIAKRAKPQLSTISPRVALAERFEQ